MAKRPKWAVAIEMAGGTVPGMIYDKQGLPFGFALFSDQKKADKFLSFRGKFKGKSLRLCVDIGLSQFQNWAMQWVRNQLLARGKELTNEQAFQTVYMVMPVFLDPKDPFIHTTRVGENETVSGVKWPNLYMLIREHYTYEQCAEAIDGALFRECRHLDVKVSEEISHIWTAGVFTKPGKKPKDVNWFCVLRQGRVDNEEDLLHQSLVLGHSVHITSPYPCDSFAVKACREWLDAMVESKEKVKQEDEKTPGMVKTDGFDIDQLLRGNQSGPAGGRTGGRIVDARGEFLDRR